MANKYMKKFKLSNTSQTQSHFCLLSYETAKGWHFHSEIHALIHCLRVVVTHCRGQFDSLNTCILFLLIFPFLGAYFCLSSPKSLAGPMTCFD